MDYKQFEGRPHFTAGAPGWEAVAAIAASTRILEASARAGTDQRDELGGADGPPPGLC